MKTLKLITALVMAGFFFTACQEEESTEVGTNPRANSSTSTVAKNYERASMNDGSKDDFLDGNSCTQLLFPINATINGKQIRLLSELDFEAALEILGEFNDDSDQVTLGFPLRVKTKNYTEVIVTSQSQLDTLKQECENAENNEEDPISCIKFNFPFTMVTYNLSFQQTGQVILQSEKQLFLFMNNLQADELFAVNYPISASLSNGTSVQINSDADFQKAISDCVNYEDEKEEAASVAAQVNAVVSKSKFRVESFINAGVNTANNYINWSIEFTNNMKLEAKNTVNSAISSIEGTYKVSSETEVFMNLTFQGNSQFSALNKDWIVTSYTNTMLQLKSKTDAAVTLTLVKL